VSSNPVQDDVYSIQHYVIKFVSDLRQVCGLFWFPPHITEILLKVALNTKSQTFICKIVIPSSKNSNCTKNDHWM